MSCKSDLTDSDECKETTYCVVLHVRILAELVELSSAYWSLDERGGVRLKPLETFEGRV